MIRQSCGGKLHFFTWLKCRKFLHEWTWGVNVFENCRNMKKCAYITSQRREYDMITLCIITSRYCNMIVSESRLAYKSIKISPISADWNEVPDCHEYQGMVADCHNLLQYLSLLDTTQDCNITSAYSLVFSIYCLSSK